MLKESAIQRAIVEWANWEAKNDPRLEMLVHVPNQGARTGRFGFNLKRMGLKPGFPDLFLFVPVGQFAGLALELKSEKGKLSDKQNWWLMKLQQHHYKTAVGYSVSDGVFHITNYLMGR